MEGKNKLLKSGDLDNISIGKRKPLENSDSTLTTIEIENNYTELLKNSSQVINTPVNSPIANLEILFRDYKKSDLFQYQLKYNFMSSLSLSINRFTTQIYNNAGKTTFMVNY